MSLFIVTIGRFKHDLFRMSYFSTTPESIENYVIEDDSSSQATYRVVKYCEELTEKVNKYAKENYMEYDKYEDEVKYKLLNIYDINELNKIE
jgi:hypothetical protein